MGWKSFFVAMRQYQARKTQAQHPISSHQHCCVMTTKPIILIILLSSSTSALLGGVSGFSSVPTPIRIPTHTHSTTTEAAEEVVLKTKVPVARISVCAGELCQCQGEEFEYTGGASDAVIDKLRQLNLSFPIDEVGCLGACGMGTMIAIDFENGDSIMTDGLESTYSELGIPFKAISSTDSSSARCDVAEATTLGSASAIRDADEVITSAVSAIVATKSPAAPKQVSSSSKKLVDVRDRMRKEAASNKKVENPWLKMASYLAKKATDKVFGSD